MTATPPRSGSPARDERATSCIGWGKIILLGEHAVVYGYPALAASLDRGVTVDPVPTPAGGPLRLDIPAWELRVAAGRDVEHHQVGRALAAIADSLGVGTSLVTLAGDAQIPCGEGLGSSAAMAVAVARALLVHARREPDVAAIRAAAMAGETIFHGRPSGLDVELAIAGAAGVFRRGAGLRPIALPAPLRVLVGPSGERRSTGDMVARVAQATGATADDPRLAELGGLTDTGTAALLARDLPRLGAAMNRAQAVLAGLGVSTPRLDSLCEAARAAGAYGAKLTGAGGGGSVIAIAPRDKERAVLTEWRATDVNGFVATLGAGPS